MADRGAESESVPERDGCAFRCRKFSLHFRRNYIILNEHLPV